MNPFLLYCLTSIRELIPEPQASLVNAMLFGINLPNYTELIPQLKKTGLLHVVVLSGSNISLIAGSVQYISRFLSKKYSVLLTIGFICFFVSLVKPEAPIIRASFMTILTLVAILFGKKSTPIYLLFLSGIIFILFSPRMLSSLSFQLSYGSTLGILLFYRPKTISKKSWLYKHKVIKDISLYVRNSILISVSAQLGILPIVLFRLKQLSVLFPLSSILTSWAVPPLVLSGYLLPFFHLLFPPIAVVTSWVTYGLSVYFLEMVSLLNQIPFGVFSW